MSKIFTLNVRAKSSSEFVHIFDVRLGSDNDIRFLSFRLGTSFKFSTLAIAKEQEDVAKNKERYRVHIQSTLYKYPITFKRHKIWHENCGVVY